MNTQHRSGGALVHSCARPLSVSTQHVQFLPEPRYNHYFSLANVLAASSLSQMNNGRYLITHMTNISNARIPSNA